MTQPIYAIGDIHGQLAMLENALKLIEADGGRDATIVFVGDYIDRGPESRGVVDVLIEGEKAGKPWVMLKGNHDRYLTRFLDDMRITDPRTSAPGLTWLHPRLGGDKTLASYGVDATPDGPLEEVLDAARAAVPQAHVTFLENRPLLHRTEDKLFVHAGLKPGVAIEDQEEDDLLWIREPFLSHKKSFGPLVVHGHTSLDAPEHKGNRVNLDGGAGYFRPLHPAVFEGQKCWLLTSAGRVPLDPS
ncbi:MAG: metallophosphoesterase family protein [Roseobacter sp.]